MQKDTFVLLAKYNAAANLAMNGLMDKLNSGEWDAPLGGYFPSVRSLCSHLYICDFNWLKRFSRLRDFAALDTPFFTREPYSFKDVLFDKKDDYQARRPELDGQITAFTGELRDEDLASPLVYTDSSGARYEKNFGGLLLHCFNHGTHHRGMISLYLELLGRDNDFNSLARVIDNRQIDNR
jgi:uncharacterized damage-inducible protein DinB